jgi:hypothetical protein
VLTPPGRLLAFAAAGSTVIDVGANGHERLPELLQRAADLRAATRLLLERAAEAHRTAAELHQRAVELHEGSALRERRRGHETRANRAQTRAAMAEERAEHQRAATESVRNKLQHPVG